LSTFFPLCKKGGIKGGIISLPILWGGLGWGLRLCEYAFHPVLFSANTIRRTCKGRLLLPSREEQPTMSFWTLGTPRRPEPLRPRATTIMHEVKLCRACEHRRTHATATRNSPSQVYESESVLPAFPRFRVSAFSSAHRIHSDARRIAVTGREASVEADRTNQAARVPPRICVARAVGRWKRP
jgi:hypothetical protein